MSYKYMLGGIYMHVYNYEALKNLMLPMETVHLITKETEYVAYDKNDLEYTSFVLKVNKLQGTYPYYQIKNGDLIELNKFDRPSKIE